jgi:hypothetical protein
MMCAFIGGILSCSSSRKEEIRKNIVNTPHSYYIFSLILRDMLLFIKFVVIMEFWWVNPFENWAEVGRIKLKLVMRKGSGQNEIRIL